MMVKEEEDSAAIVSKTNHMNREYAVEALIMNK